MGHKTTEAPLLFTFQLFDSPDCLWIARAHKVHPLTYCSPLITFLHRTRSKAPRLIDWQRLAVRLLRSIMYTASSVEYFVLGI